MAVIGNYTPSANTRSPKRWECISCLTLTLITSIILAKMHPTLLLQLHLVLSKAILPQCLIRRHSRRFLSSIRCLTPTLMTSLTKSRSWVSGAPPSTLPCLRRSNVVTATDIFLIRPPTPVLWLAIPSPSPVCTIQCLRSLCRHPPQAQGRVSRILWIRDVSNVSTATVTMTRRHWMIVALEIKFCATFLPTSIKLALRPYRIANPSSYCATMSFPLALTSKVLPSTTPNLWMTSSILGHLCNSCCQCLSCG